MSAFGLDLHAWLWLFSAIISVESNGDSSAVGDGGKAVGCMQIHPCVIEDVNRIYNKDYRLSDRYDPDECMDIAYLYLYHYGKHYYRTTGEAPTFETLARIWNGGPNGWKKSSTNKYWIKIKKTLNDNA
tara:strand:+ start:740 stop:1126 length:387 start_codon:yes stop_codon:yes gene_type:complete